MRKTGKLLDSVVDEVSVRLQKRLGRGTAPSSTEYLDSVREIE